MRGWNVRPNTAARRRIARSSGVSASMRAMVAASAESGRPPTPPESMATRKRSRRNCGLPPDRLATTSSTCEGSGCCSAASLSSEGSSAVSGARSILHGCGRVRARRRGVRGRRATHDDPRTHWPRSRDVREQLARRRVDMMRVFEQRSASDRAAGRQELDDGLVQLGPRWFFSASMSTSGVDGTSTPKAMATSGSQGRSGGAEVGDVSRILAATVSSGSSRPKGQTVPAAVPATRHKASSAVYASQTACSDVESVASSRSASTSRDLPTPASPTSSKACRCPTARQRPARRAALRSPRSRPVSGSACRVPCRVREPTAFPTSHASTGFALPLTRNG